MRPRVGIAAIKVESTDGSFTIGREAFPEFSLARLGVHVQSDQFRIATPEPAYVEVALTELAEACQELGVPDSDIAFVDTVVPPPTIGLRYGFKGAFTTDYPTIIWVVANWTSTDELRVVVRHEAAHRGRDRAPGRVLAGPRRHSRRRGDPRRGRSPAVAPQYCPARPSSTRSPSS